MGIDAVDYSFGNFANSLGAYNSANYLASSALSNIGSNAALCAYNPCLTGGLTYGFNGGLADTISWNKQWNLANQGISLDNVKFGATLSAEQLNSTAEQLNATNKFNIKKEQINEPQQQVNYQAERLKKLIKSGKYKQAKAVFDGDFRNVVSAKLTNAGCILGEGKEGYPTLQTEFLNATGITLAVLLDEEGQFKTGMKEGIGCGAGLLIFEDSSEFRNQVLGEEETNLDKAKRWAGRITAGIITVLGLYGIGKGMKWAVRAAR